MPTAPKTAHSTAPTLHDQQASLLVHLTSAAAIFGDGDGATVPAELRGINPAALRLEARLSHAKRMEKITAVFPRTFALLGDNAAAVVRGFAQACPPVDSRRMTNARQFAGFLSSARRTEPRDPRYNPPHVADVAACELAFGEARMRADRAAEAAPGGPVRPADWIRRAPGVLLLRCAYDVRPCFETASRGTVPVARDTPLAVRVPPAAVHPQVFELAPAAFDLLARIGDWTDPAMLADASDLPQLLSELAQCGLIEAPRVASVAPAPAEPPA